VLIDFFPHEGNLWFVFVVYLKETLTVESGCNTDDTGGQSHMVSNKIENMFADDSNWVCKINGSMFQVYVN
jgi:hypothetical protein